MARASHVPHMPLAACSLHPMPPCAPSESPQELSRVEPLPGCAPPKVEFLPLDLGSLASVRKFVKDFNRSGRDLSLLVCNAGARAAAPTRALRADAAGRRGACLRGQVCRLWLQRPRAIAPLPLSPSLF